MKKENTNNLIIEIPLKIPIGRIIRIPILEMNKKSLSFLISEKEGYFIEGTILNDIKLFDDTNEKFIKKARVLNCCLHFKKTDIDTFHKITLEIIDISDIERNKRYSANFLKGSKDSIFYTNNLGEVYVATLKDFSQEGLSFIISSNKFNLFQGSIIKELKVIIDDKIKYNGKAIITNYHNEKNNVIVRVKLEDGNINLKELYNGRLKNRVIYEKEEIQKILKNIKYINPEFKKYVSDIVYILWCTKNNIDIFEKELIYYDNETKEKLIKEIFETWQKNISPQIKYYIKAINQIVYNDYKEKYEIYKEYFQKNLHPLILKGALPNRIYTRPLIFPGDYEMMNMIFRNTDEGNTLYEKLIHLFVCSWPEGQANRNRSEYLYEKIRDFQYRLNKLKITSIACGSAIEIQKYISREEKSNKAFITLIDFEKEALNYSKNRLNKLINEHKRKTGLKFIQEDILRLIRRKESLEQIEDNQDIIYSIGLFEYLSTSICQKFIKTLYTKLNTGGLMILGNYYKEPPYRAAIELGLNWNLIYRDENELMELANNVNADISIEQEPLGLIKFLVIKK